VRLKDTAPDLLIFDVDGVLIDTCGSYMLATAETICWCWQNLLGGSVDRDGYTMEYFNITKTHPAFNDDVAIAWAMLHSMRRTGRKSMKEAFPSLETWKKELGTFAAGTAVEELARKDAQTPSLDEVRSVLEEIYFGTEIYAEFKGKARGMEKEGLWKVEKPGVLGHWKELGLPVGIYTGRTRDEMVLGYKILNWLDFPDNMLICSNDGILKPSPEGLAVLCERSGAKHPAFFGDTASDRVTWGTFGKGEFIAIGPILEAESRNEGFLHFDTLEEALSFLLPLGGQRQTK